MSNRPKEKRAVRKPTLNGVPGDYILPVAIRDSCGLNLLTLNAREWPSVEKLVDAYFQDANVWSSSHSELHKQLLDGFACLDHTSVRPCVKSFARQVRLYLQAPCIVDALKKYYHFKERIATQRQHALLAEIEGDITGAALSQRGAKRLLEEDNNQATSSSTRQRVLLSIRTDTPDVSELSGDSGQNDALDGSNQYEEPLLDLDEPANISPSVKKSQYSFVSNGKRFDYHTPSRNLVSPKKPVLSQTDHRSLSDLFEIRLSSGTQGSCSHDTESLYEQYQDQQHANSCLKTHTGAISFLTTALDPDNFLDTSKLWALPGQGKFIDMMRHILTDYYQTCRRASPLDLNQERTFFCECVVPIFRNFGVLIGDISGSWCEKQLLETKRVWLPLKDFRVTGITRKLHDGILSNKAETIAIILESSGSEHSTAHIIDDTYKQLKSTSDFYKYLISKYTMGSLQTLMAIKIPCVTIISNCLTLCLTTIHNEHKWKYVEVRSCVIPTNTKERKAWIKAFEFLACLEDVVNLSLKSIEQLENESLGYTTLDSNEILVKDYLM
ncbi:Ubiquitin fusion degradation protein 4 [Mucor velutinosus]|uniref:Ubiquitin fusion degradation protein 4 n=1 Tax=Mucor velutinosus TaxID=708070 RepID=A0AAN7DHP2_9FUNG|nr:Ubiquitin fusion degradation protein 4 [Mucor velutinosus]